MRPASSFGQIFSSPWVLAFAVLLSFYWQLGAVPLYDLDEGAFTEATREMLASGNYITPHKDGEPRYDKPALIYWLQAASVKVLGLNELALRLPSALAATGWLIGLWWFVRERLDAPTATVAALVMALTLQVSVIAKAATADAVLNLFLALVFFDMYRHYLRPARGTLLRVYLWMGLGFLTKGPVAVFFPVLVSFLFYLSERSLKDWLRAAFSPLGWVLFLVVAVPWYVAIYLDSGAGFFESFFLRHNLGRFGDAMHGHKGFAGYYFVVLPLILLPFTGWFLRLLPAIRRGWADPLDRFLWLWFAAVFVVFSFSGTKLPHYLLYGATPLFILMARHRELLASRWLAYVPPVAFFLLLLLLPDVVDLLAEQADRAHQVALFEEGRRVLDGGYRLAVAGGLVVLLILAFWRRFALWQSLLLVGFVQTILVFGVLVPRVFEVMQAPVKEAALVARGMDLPTVVYRTSMPSFSVYREAITPDRDPRPGELVFLRVDKLERLGERFPQLEQELVYRRGAVALVKMTAGQGDG
ncbi:MAG: glycosyltransferase family 39 protein [Pseudomonadota bacterium]|nr:glycosyltransferase family 39 protein [Pseudomonadota bacterium]